MTAEERLDKALANNRFSHAWMFIGPEDRTGALAGTAAKALLCRGQAGSCGVCQSCLAFESGNNPDVIYIRPDKKTSVSAELIREGVVADARIKPYYSRYKAYVIERADLMTAQAQNILLKTLEEPPPYGIFLLCAENKENILPTVLSRCVMINASGTELGKLSGELKRLREGLSIDECYFYAALSGGTLEKAAALSEPMEGEAPAHKMRDSILDILTGLDNLKSHEILLRAKTLEEFKDESKLMLDIMALWYRDCAVRAVGGEIIQRDIAALIDRHADWNAAKKIGKIEEARGHLMSNTGFLLTIEVLLMKLSNNLI